MAPHTATNVLLAKAALVLVVFCFAEVAAGSKYPKSSCLKYGHSCWGAHGKRNGVGGGGVPVANTRWYLSRLVQAPADLRLWREGHERHALVPRSYPMDRHLQNDSDVDMDYPKRVEDSEDAVGSEQEDADEEVVFMEDPSVSLGQKLRLYKLMKKNAEKLN